MSKTLPRQVIGEHAALRRQSDQCESRAIPPFVIDDTYRPRGDCVESCFVCRFHNIRRHDALIGQCLSSGGERSASK